MHASSHLPTPSRRGFALPWACGAVVIAAAAIAFIAMLIAVGVRGGSDPTAISRAMGAMAAVLLIAALIGGITYKFTHEKSPWIGTSITALIILGYGLQTAATFGGGSLSWTSPSVWRDLDRLNSSMVQEVREAVDNDVTTVDIEGIVAGHAAEFDKLRSRMQGDDLIAFDVGIGFSRDVATITATYLTALRPFIKAGGIDPKTLTSKESIVKRRELLQMAHTIHTTALAAFEKTPQDLNSRATRLGMNAADAARLTETMLGGMRFQKLLRIQRIESDLAVVMDEHLADLQKRWSNWKYKDGQVLFSEISQKNLDAFNARLQRLQSLAAEQSSVQAELTGPRRSR